MQLKKPPLRQALALASCALVHGTAHGAEGDWKLSGALLSYDEKDRISVEATTLFATKDLGDERSLTVRGVYDSLSGASPNGASATTTPQTFTGASGQSAYTTPAYQLPTKTFSDERAAAGVDYVTRTSPTSGRTLSADISKESDYLSMGGSATWTEDYNNKLTTLAFGLGGSYDTVQAKGFPTGLQSTSAAATTTCASGGGGGGDEDDEGGGCEEDGKIKTTLNLLTGVTQVLSRRSLAQFNFTLAHSDGYL
ncbi:MAG TPA: DUF3570 domain-containing protein, partial [Geothrix sp.]|nr:DUF3570 domain-containing protein [Geothrix sp.]